MNANASNYTYLVGTLLDNFHILGIKFHLLANHLNEFAANLGDVVDEHGENFNEKINFMEVI